MPEPTNPLVAELREVLRARREAARLVDELRAREVELLELAVNDGTPMLKIAHAVRDQFGCSARACVEKLRKRLNKRLDRAQKRRRGDTVSPDSRADGLPPLIDSPTVDAEVRMPKQLIRETTTTTTKEYVDSDAELDDVDVEDEDTDDETEDDEDDKAPSRSSRRRAGR